MHSHNRTKPINRPTRVTPLARCQRWKQGFSTISRCALAHGFEPDASASRLTKPTPGPGWDLTPAAGFVAEFPAASALWLTVLDFRGRLLISICTLVILLMMSSALFGQLPEIRGRSSSSTLQAGRLQTSPASTTDTSTNAATTWFRIELSGQPIGFEYTTVTASPQQTTDGASLLQRTRETQLQLKRFGQDLSMSSRLTTTETSDGLLYDFQLTRTSADGSTLIRSGSLRADKTGYELTERIAGSEHRQLLTTQTQCRSVNVSDWILSAYPSNRRTWRTAILYPETGALADVEFRKIGAETLRVSAGNRVAVTRYEYWPVRTPESRTVLFVNDAQQVVRMEQPLAGSTIRFERSDAATAMGQQNTETLDLQFQGLLPVRGTLKNAGSKPSINLKITVAAPHQIALPFGDFQEVEAVSTAELKVRLLRADLPDPGQTGVPRSTNARRVKADAIYLSASRWIDKDHDDVRRLATMVAGGTSVADEKCRRLTKHLAKSMRNSGFSTSLLPASTVAKSLKGDCTEHAVLLCALLRHQGLPARVAVGFVYVPNLDSFAPHMWTEVFLDGQWIPLDSTRGSVGSELAHIKVADSALSDEVGAGTVLFMPLMNFLGRAQIAVTSDMP